MERRAFGIRTSSRGVHKGPGSCFCVGCGVCVPPHFLMLGGCRVLFGLWTLWLGFDYLTVYNGPPYRLLDLIPFSHCPAPQARM